MEVIQAGLGIVVIAAITEGIVSPYNRVLKRRIAAGNRGGMASPSVVVIGSDLGAAGVVGEP